MIPGDKRLDLAGQRTLLNEWAVYARSGRPASRADMQPAQFLAELAYVSILERVDGKLKFRLAGSEVRSWLGTEGRGKCVDDFPKLTRSSMWTDSVFKSLASEQPLAGAEPLARGQVYFWLRLPLACAQGDVCQVMSHDRILDAESVARVRRGEDIDSPMRRAA